MLLSAVSVSVVAQSSSEIPEGLMNNPVYKKRSLESSETPVLYRGSAVLKVKVTPPSHFPLTITLMVRNIHFYYSSYQKVRKFTFFMDCTRVTTFMGSKNTNNTSRKKGKLLVHIPLTAERKNWANWCMGWNKWVVFRVSGSIIHNIRGKSLVFGGWRTWQRWWAGLLCKSGGNGRVFVLSRRQIRSRYHRINSIT